MTTGLSYLDFRFAVDTSLYCFGVVNCIQYANRTRQNFPVVEQCWFLLLKNAANGWGGSDFLREFIGQG